MSAAQTSELLAWFRSNGGYLNEDVEIAEDAENGINLRACRPVGGLSPTEVSICRCPLILSLSYLNVRPSTTRPQALPELPCTDGVAVKLVGHAPVHVVSYFALIEQRLLGKDSFWAPYIDCLPKESNLNTPLFFSDEDQQWLLGTNLLPAAQARLAQWKSDWQAACDALRKGNVESVAYTFDLYLWAGTIFTSRSFTSRAALPDSDEAFPLLYPVLDIANHRFGAKVVWNFEQGTFDFRTAEPVSVGGQVFNNYGPKGNEELLMGYGFCIPENPCDEVAIRLSKPPSPVHRVLQSFYSSNFPSAEWTVYLRGRRHYSGGHENALLGAGGIPHLMFIVLVLIVAHTRGQRLEAAASNPTARQVVGAIRHLLVPLQAKRDAIMGPAKDLAEPKNTRQKYARMYRTGQLAILTDVIDQLEGKLKNFRQAGHDLGLGPPSAPGKLLVSNVSYGPATEQAHTATPLPEILPAIGALPEARKPVSGIILELEDACAILNLCEDIRLSDYFKRGLETGLGTCVVADLRENDVEDVVWTLWLCAARIIAGTSASTGSPISRMVPNLIKDYPIDSEFVSNEDAVQYIEDIRAAASADRECAELWGSELWTTKLSAWAARVVELEAWPWEGRWVMFFEDPRTESL